MTDLLDTTPGKTKGKKKATKKTAAVRKAAPASDHPGRAPAARTVKIRERIVEALKGKRNGVLNRDVAEALKISSGECLKLAQLLIREGKVVASKNAAGQVVLKRG